MSAEAKPVAQGPRAPKPVCFVRDCPPVIIDRICRGRWEVLCEHGWRCGEFRSGRLARRYLKRARA